MSERLCECGHLENEHKPCKEGDSACVHGEMALVRIIMCQCNKFKPESLKPKLEE